jgi:hypothetical protein
MTTIEEEQEQQQERNDWKGKIIIAIPKILKEIKAQGRRPPSLRGLFYILLDRKLIVKKSDEHYHTLSDETTKARLDPDYNYKGKPKHVSGQPQEYLLELDSLRDESRPSHEDIPSQTPDEFITEDIIQRIRHPERYYIPNRWYKQKHFVVIVIEKSALFEDFLTIIEQEDLQVMLFALGGYYGTTDISHLYDILTYHQQVIKQRVHVLYFGDYDGHGLAIDKNVKEKLQKISDRYLSEHKFGWVLDMLPRYQDPDNGVYIPLPPEQQDFSFERLAVTLSQIKKYGLQVLNERVFETAGEVEAFYTQGKKKDFAKRDFALVHLLNEDYRYYFEVEVDGIVSSRWEIVKQLVVDNVLKYWDPKIWESVKEELSIDRVKEQLEARIDLSKQEDRERTFPPMGDEEGKEERGNDT